MEKELKHGFRLLHGYCNNCNFQIVPHRSTFYTLKEYLWEDVERAHKRFITNPLIHRQCTGQSLMITYGFAMMEQAKSLIVENSGAPEKSKCDNPNCIDGVISLDGQAHLPCLVCNAKEKSATEVTPYKKLPYPF